MSTQPKLRTEAPTPEIPEAAVAPAAVSSAGATTVRAKTSIAPPYFLSRSATTWRDALERPAPAA